MTAVQNSREGLNIRQAAEELGVHYQTVRNWIANGTLPYTQFGTARPGTRRIIRIHPDDLEPLRRSSHGQSSS